MKTVLAATMLLIFAGSSVALAQDDTATKEMKKEQMSHHMKSFACDESCGFAVQSQDEKEVAGMIKQHMKGGCQCCANMSEEDIKGMIKEGSMEKMEVEKEIKKEKKMTREAESDPVESRDDD